MTAPDLAEALEALRRRLPHVRGRRVDDLAVELHADGTGCLVAIVPPFTPAGAILDDGEVVARFHSVEQLGRMLSGAEPPEWWLHDELVKRGGRKP